MRSVRPAIIGVLTKPPSGGCVMEKWQFTMLWRLVYAYVTIYCGLTAVIGEEIHQWTSCGTWLWPLRDGQNSTGWWLQMPMSNLVSKLAACHQHRWELVQCHKMCLADLQSLYYPIFTLFMKYIFHPGWGHGSLTCHMTQFEWSDWLRSANVINIMIEYWMRYCGD